MPFWFVALAFIAALLFIAVQVTWLVVISTLYSFGLARPLWLLAANLWWLVILIAPLVIMHRRGKLRTGLIATGGLALAAWLVPIAVIHADRARILPDVMTTEAGSALVAGPPHSIEVVWPEQGEGAPGLGDNLACGSLCERLLTGGDIEWVRVRLPKYQIPNTKIVKSPVVVFQRGTAGDCQRLLPDFDPSSACLLAVADEGSKADLQVVFTSEGDGHVGREDLKLTTFAFSQNRVVLSDVRQGRAVVLGDETQVRYMEPVHWFPLVPNAGFDGNGLHGSGLTYRWRRAETAPVDVFAMLETSGVKLGAARPKIKDPSESDPRFQKDLVEPRPYDAAVVASLIAVADSPFPAAITQNMNLWIESFLRGAAASDSDRLVLRNLNAVLPVYAIPLEHLRTRRPELFYDGFTQLHDSVISGTDEESRKAAATLLKIVRRAAPGTHDGEAADFIRAFQSGREREYLIQIIGRYGFDPTPYLKDYLAENSDYVGQVLELACSSDPNWPDTLAPFVHGIIKGKLDGATLGEIRRLDLHEGITALVKMDRLDLVEDIRSRIDWDALLPEYRDGGNPKATLEVIQTWVLGSGRSC